MRFLLVLLAATTTALAADAPKPCSGPAYRQFDFWAGDWVVTDPAGKQVGTNRIDVELDGCVLHENWAGASGYRGQSLNFFDRRTGKWTQTWIGTDGGALILTGGLRGKEMILRGEAPDAKGNPALQRITWTPLDGGKVRQLWESSSDGGKTWTTAFDGTYAKR